MKIAIKIGVILVFVFSIASKALSIDLAGEYEPSFFKSRNSIIDPDKAAYGVSFGAKESGSCNKLVFQTVLYGLVAVVES